MAVSVGDLLVNIKSDTTQLISGFNKAEAAVNKTTKQMSYAVKGLIGAFVGLNTLDIAKNFTTQLDLITSANNKLKLVTKTTEEYTIAQKRLFEVAQITNQGYSETVSLYSKLSDSMLNMGKSQSDIFRTVETVNKAIALSGSSAEEASAAVLQLGQAFGSGLLQGDELKSINENAQGLAKAIAEGMGVAVGELKQLGADGKITSEILAKALEKVANSTDEKYGKMTKTIAQSMQIVQNSISQVIAQFDKMTGISNVVADSIQGISKALDSISSYEMENLFNTLKVGAEIMAAAYVGLKILKGGYSAYNSALLEINTTAQKNIDIENSKAKAYSDGMKSVYARKIADEALNTGMLNGVALKDKQINALQKEAVQLENVAKKQVAYSYSLESSAKSFNMASLGATALKTAMSTIPFIAITTGIGLIAQSLFTASKNSELLTETLSKSSEELQKLTANQLEYRKSLLQTEIIQARLDLANAKADAASNGIFENDMDRKKDLDYLDEKTKRFDELQKSIKTISEIQNKTKTPDSKKTSSSQNKQLDTLSDDVKNIINPTEVIIEKYAKLFQNLTESGKSTAENIALITAKMNEEIANLDKDGTKAFKDVQKEKERLAKEAQEKIKDLTKEATDLTISDVDKINAKYLEMYNVIKDTFSQEQMKAFNTSWQEAVEKANGTLDAQKAKQDLVNQALATATNEVDTINNKYMEMYEAIKDNPMFDDAKMAEFYKKWQDELDKTKEKLDFNTTIELDIIGDDKSVQRISKSFDDLQKATKKYEDNRKTIAKGSEEEAKNEEMFRKDQMNGYINMAGALGSMFEQGSKEAATFQAAQLSLALVEGTRAILTSGTGDPYTAIPRMAAMGIMVKSLLGNIGVALGMNSTSTSGDSFSMQTTNTGTGSALGDSKKASESITNALKTLEDFAEPNYEVLNSMNSYLKTIANNISGVSSLLVQNSATALGTNYTGGFDTGYKNNLKTANGAFVFNPINDLISKIPIVGQINGAIGSIINSAIGGIFGKTSVTRTLKDSGITFADALLKNAKNDFQGSAYQTIATTVSKKSWFRSSSYTYLSTAFTGLNDEIEDQFSLVLGGLYDTVLLSGKALDISSQSLYNSLDNFVVSIGKVSLKDKTGTEIQEILTNIFSKIGDDLTKSVIPNLTGFQQVGEGLFDTLTRVAIGIQESEFYIDRLGTSIVKYTDIVNKQGVVGFEALAQSIIKADEATYGLNNGVVKMIDNMNGTTEELYNTYLSFENIRDVLIATNHSASNLSSSMILGAGSISALESGTSAYMENFLTDSERIKVEMSRLSDEFSIAGYTLPQTREDFVNLINSINTSTDEGAKAYGRLISLSDEYSDAISALEDIQAEALATQAEAALNLKNQLLSLTQRLEDSKADDAQQLLLTRQRELANYTDATSLSLLKQIYSQEDYNKKVAETKTILEKLLGTFTNLGDSISDTIKTLAGANTDSMSATQQIKSFWEKRKEIDSLLALNGNLTESQQSRLSDLVGEVNDLATNIQGLDSSSSSITNELIGNLTSLESALNFKEQVLSVNIVGIASNVALIENIAGISATVPTLTNNTSNYVTNSDLSTDIKDILTTIKDNISNYPKRTMDLIDDVIRGNSRVKVQSN